MFKLVTYFNVHAARAAWAEAATSGIATIAARATARNRTDRINIPNQPRSSALATADGQITLAGPDAKQQSKWLMGQPMTPARSKWGGSGARAGLARAAAHYCVLLACTIGGEAAGGSCRISVWDEFEIHT